MLKRVLEPEVMDSAQDAAEYDAMDHCGPNEAFVERLLELEARGPLLDIGCGPGDILLMLAERLPDLEALGIDLSKSMLALAREKADARSLAGQLRFEFADACRLPYPDGQFATVCSNTILHHIPDPAPFLREAWRVLRPGGLLVIRDLFRPASLDALERLVACYAGDCNAYQRKLFADSLHAALTPDELRELATALDMRDAELVIDTDRHMSLQGRKMRTS